MGNTNNYKEKIIFFDITGKCNLQCKHCYQWKNFQKSGRDQFEIPFSEIRSTIDKLVEEKFTRLHILGGEPLLSPLLMETIKYVKIKGLIVSLVTNGLLLFKNAEELFKNGIDLVSVSFEGTSPKYHDYIRGKGNYSRTMSSIKKTMKYFPKIPIAAVYTITNSNIDDVGNIPIWLKNNQFLGINLQIVGMDGNAINNQNLKIDTVKALMEIEKIFPDLLGTGLEIDIKTSNLVKRYFEIKFGVNMGIVDERCKGLRKQIYWSRGKLLPCNAAEPYVKSLNFKNTKLNDTTFKYSKNKFRTYTRNLNIYNKLKPCDECKYFGKKCLPCPIINIWNKNTYQLNSCLWANNQIDNIRKGVKT